MSATIKSGSDRTFVNRDGQHGVMVYDHTLDEMKYLRIDSVTGAVNTIDYAHHEIHGGSHYYISGSLAMALENDTFYIKLVTPDTPKWVHFTFAISSLLAASTTFYEDATGGMTGGSSVTPINNNRNSSNTSGVVLTSGVLANTGQGVILENLSWGADTNKIQAGGGTARADELILKQNSVYCRKFLSLADNNILQFKASWYEHTNRT